MAPAPSRFLAPTPTQAAPPSRPASCRAPPPAFTATSPTTPISPSARPPQIGNGGPTGVVAGNITANAALIFNRSDAVTYAGVISGSGTVTQAGAGTLSFTGANSYTGATAISSGVLNIRSNTALGTI